MEDEFFVSNDGDFAAVFDGHGGKAVSRYLRKNLYANVQAFLPLVQHNEQQQDDSSGNGNSESSTTNTPTTTQRTILAANIGDSRAVLCRNNKAWDLSRDHKPNDPDEKSRIESLGGSVVWCGDTDKFGQPIGDQGIYRVNGNLALSRAIGDRSERPHVTAEPEIISVPIEEGDQFIVVATDGLWDVMDSDDAVNYVNVLLESGVSRKKVATLMVQEAMRLGTYDNVTVVIIWMDST
ncbi:protein serine/threonine phosphatase 2C [Fragilariopsis cylindrus CCMP1102]|uniref:Protein serine/threonine phosphatase 2C n=1 Tax=Fragilariopsis cylindrus CCMP1102 TaxID=635003 RepID=A0A1E7FE79_9STRA|nr:protein serine/threonine phosphatase 2C [Fragilariopsis cylindrus CCMP1102]|eukprot:OEU16444.1 protein serine/threonine phosphatase 2C [Fragilariopsis cylindrus CCMP1102]